MTNYLIKDAAALDRFLIPGGAALGGTIAGIASYKDKSIQGKPLKEKLKLVVPATMGGALWGGVLGSVAKTVRKVYKMNQQWAGGSRGSHRSRGSYGSQDWDDFFKNFSKGSGGSGGRGRGRGSSPRQVEDAYKFFGLKKNPKLKRREVKKAWYSYMKKHHPSKHFDSPESMRKTQVANEHWNRIIRDDKAFFDKLSRLYLTKTAVSDSISYFSFTKKTPERQGSDHSVLMNRIVRKMGSGYYKPGSCFKKIAETIPVYKKTKFTPTTQTIIDLGEEWINRKPPKGIIKEVKKTTFNKQY